MSDADDRDEQIARLRTEGERVAAELTVASASPALAVESHEADPTPAIVSHARAVPAVAYDLRPVSKPWPLRHPFTIDGVRITALHFREPSFADVEDCITGRITEHELHARMAGVDVAVLQSLRWSDSEIMTLLARTIAPELRSF